MIPIRRWGVLCLTAALTALGPAVRAQGGDEPAPEQAAEPAPSPAIEVPPAPVRRPRPRNYRASQRQPTQQRFRQIQQALIDRGYLEGPADGYWGPKSQAALKEFEREQNLAADGKIDSLSLIALGLGPKRASSLAAPATQPAPAASPETAESQ